MRLSQDRFFEVLGSRPNSSRTGSHIPKDPVLYIFLFNSLCWYILGRFTKICPKYQLTREFLTKINIKKCHFSLLAWISHFVAAHALISHIWLEFLTFGLNFSLFATFPAKFSLSSKFLTFSAGPTPTPAGPLPRRPALFVSPVGPSHADPPNDMVTTMLLACSDGLARAGRSPFDMPTCKKWEIQIEKWEIRVIAHN